MGRDSLRLFADLTISISSEGFRREKFSSAIQSLCDKAPDFAQFLREELSKRLGGNEANGPPNPGMAPLRKRKLDDSPRRPAKTRKTAKARVYDEVATAEPPSSRDNAPEPPSSRDNEREPSLGPSTPEAQRKQETPATEEVPRAVPWAATAVLPLESKILIPDFEDMVTEGIATINKMSSYQRTVPKEDYLAILHFLQSNNSCAPALPRYSDRTQTTTNAREWTGMRWSEILVASDSRTKVTRVLDMVVQMGAVAWYDAEVENLKRSHLLTKRGKVMIRLTTPLLDSLLYSGNEKGMESIQDKVNDEERKNLIRLFSKGRKLRTMVSKTSLGILLLNNIGAYRRMEDCEFDKVAASLRGNSKITQLLSLFENQIVQLIEKGEPDLSSFLNSLESNDLLPQSTISNLQLNYTAKPLPESMVVEELDRLTLSIYDKFNGEVDSIKVGDATIELGFDSLGRLSPGRWLDMSVIAAAMELADKPAYVRYGLSVPLHEEESGDIVPVTNPFREWRKKIDKYRAEVGDNANLIYFCPLNLNTNHFTLLEVNERTRMIYHYDSLSGGGRTSLVKKPIEAAFGDFGFDFREAPCPRQKDGSSCGLMVIRNAQLRMIGKEVGKRNDVVDVHRIIREVIRLLNRGLEFGALQPKTLARRSGRNQRSE